MGICPGLGGRAEAENFITVTFTTIVSIITFRQESRFKESFHRGYFWDKYLRDSWRTWAGGDETLNLLEGG